MSLRSLLATALVSVLAAAFAVYSTSAAELYNLSKSGTDLGSLVTSGPVDDLRFKVSYAGESPKATYVYARIGGAELRQRTNLGYWVPWNGDLAELIDNGFPISGGRIEYKVLDQNLGRDNRGMTIVIAYRTEKEFKFGSFSIIPSGKP